MNAKAAMELVRTRRSTRKFAETPVGEDELAQVIEAGRFAPSGSNSQTTHFIVIRSRGVLRELATLVERRFAAMEPESDMYVSLRNSIRMAQSPKPYVFHYDAPVLVVVCNRIGYGNAMADSACAMENMMLMANALDLGSCWINQLRWLRDDPAVRSRLLELGMTEDETVCAALALGHAATEDGLPVRTVTPRKGNPVTYVD